MSQNNIETVDQRVLGALPGGEKIKFLLRDRGLDLRGFARKYDHWREDVSRCVHGHKKCREIRDDLAIALTLTREQIDELIDGVPSKVVS